MVMSSCYNWGMFTIGAICRNAELLYCSVSNYMMVMAVDGGDWPHLAVAFTLLTQRRNGSFRAFSAKAVMRRNADDIRHRRGQDVQNGRLAAATFSSSQLCP